MRHSFLFAALISLFLAACASQDLSSRNVSQSGTLKVHPDLLGQPAPAGPASAGESRDKPGAGGDTKTNP